MMNEGTDEFCILSFARIPPNPLRAEFRISPKDISRGKAES